MRFGAIEIIIHPCLSIGPGRRLFFFKYDTVCYFQTFGRAREKELAVADPDYSEADPHPGLLLHILFLPKKLLCRCLRNPQQLQ